MSLCWPGPSDFPATSAMTVVTSLTLRLIKRAISRNSAPGKKVGRKERGGVSKGGRGGKRKTLEGNFFEKYLPNYPNSSTTPPNHA